MKVAIKSFDVGMDIKNNGIELVLSDIEGRSMVICPHEQTSDRDSAISRGA
jgi:hypothetical protein